MLSTVKSIATLIFGEDWDPEQFKLLMLSLGGVADVDSWDAVLGRDDSTVWLGIKPLRGSDRKPAEFDEYEKILGSPPRYQVFIHVSAFGESEWLAAEVVLAASDKWQLVLEGFDEQRITVAELNKRVARWRSGLFWTKNPKRQRPDIVDG